MIFRFSVIRTVDLSMARLGVCGSVAALGNWNPENALELSPSGPFSKNEPSFWVGEANISEEVPFFSYKFICKWKNNGENNNQLYEWEGCGQQHDRIQSTAERCEEEESASEEQEEEGVSTEPIVAIPPAHWLSPDGATNEMQHTTSFYFRVISDHNGIHLSKLQENLFLGSCPRQFYHVAMLKSLGITAIINLQTESDLTQNSCGVLKGKQETKIIDGIADIYRHHGIVYVWLPTEDMSTQGRIRTLPQAVFVLQGLLACGHRVYLHCNAGVGRATAVVCGFYHFIKHWSLNRTHYFVASKRPAVFVDFQALRKASEDFQIKFGEASEALKLLIENRLP